MTHLQAPEVVIMLPRGEAKKVTIYLNEDTRSHLQPLWLTILGFLRTRQVSGATVVRADAGFGAHEEMHNMRSEYIAEHAGIRIEFVDTPQRVDDLLPTLYEMVTDGLLTVQDLMVVKSTAKDFKEKPASGSPRKIIPSPAKLVRIYLGESDRDGDQPLYEAIVKKLRMMGFSGATVYRGVLGYGAKGVTHAGSRLHLSKDLPIMISVVESAEKVQELTATVAAMLQDGIIVTSDVELHRIVQEGPIPGDGSDEKSAG